MKRMERMAPLKKGCSKRISDAAAGLYTAKPSAWRQVRDMFRKNNRHLPPPLISSVSQLSAKHRQRLDDSWAGEFYREFFCRLKEEPFAALYADVPSRPNIPVNVLVGLETLKA